MSWKSGGELRKMRNELQKFGLSDGHLIAESGVSMSSLYKVFRDDPTVKAITRHRVESAFDKLKNRLKNAG